MAEQRLELAGSGYELVCVRRTGVAVYRGDGVYLRLGAAIAPEVEVQRRMLALGSPVPELLEVGETDGMPYAIEESLGEQTLGDICADRGGVPAMTAEETTLFADLLLRHARAQLRETRPWKAAELAEFLGVSRTCEHVPGLATAIAEAFGRAADRLGVLPATLQHRDLHPFNACRRGIIDLEDAGWAPAGYDVTTAFLEPTLSEGPWEDGFLTLAWFTGEQVTTYLDLLGREFARASLPQPATLVDAYLVCCAIALCSRVHPAPAVRDRRRLVLARVLPPYLDEGRFPIALGTGARAGGEAVVRNREATPAEGS